MKEGEEKWEEQIKKIQHVIVLPGGKKKCGGGVEFEEKMIW